MFAAITLLALGAAACSASSDADDGSAPGAAGRITSQPPTTEPGGGAGSSPDGDVADVLRFSAPRLGGGSIEGEDYSGRDVAFWFWAPW